MKTDNNSLPLDTSRDSAQKQLAALQKMNMNDRARMTFELSDNLRSTVEAGIRQRHPDYDQKQVKLAMFKLTLEPDLFNEAFPGCEIVP